MRWNCRGSLGGFLQNPMSCPSCAGECRCGRDHASASARFAADPESFLIDPEPYDDSEEHFAASIWEKKQALAMSCTAEAEINGLRSGQLPPARRSIVINPPAKNSSRECAPDPAAWRNEVATRVMRYRTRRGGGEALSLGFDFATETANAGSTAQCASPSAQTSILPESCDVSSAASEKQLYASEADQKSYLLHPDLLPPDTNIIQFPQPVIEDHFPVHAEQLAEPAIMPPRIFEAEEVRRAEAEQASTEFITPRLPFVEFEALAQAEKVSPAEIEMPLPVAALDVRALAWCVDAAVAGVAALLFATALAEMHALPQGRAFLALMIITAGFFWPLYQYLFLAQHGKTLGMRVTNLELADFDQKIVTKTQRRARAFSMALSAYPLGMGLIWALLDEDALCWHDRITRTFLVSRS